VRQVREKDNPDENIQILKLGHALHKTGEMSFLLNFSCLHIIDGKRKKGRKILVLFFVIAVISFQLVRY